MKLSDSKVTNPITKRIKLYWSQMLNQIKHLVIEKDWETIKQRVLAPIEHLFDCHEYCDIAWCYSLKAKNENKPYLPAPNRPFYTKEKDGKMYAQLKEAVSRFQEKDTVAECLHPFNTQKCEAFNNIVARFVPKFKHFCTTPVLDTRLATVVAITNIGYQNYYETLLNEALEPARTTHFVLAGIQKIHQKKTANSKLKQKVNTIRKRVHGKEAKAAREVLEERIDRAQNLGTYGPSVAVSSNETTNNNSPIQRSQSGIFFVSIVMLTQITQQ